MNEGNVPGGGPMEAAVQKAQKTQEAAKAEQAKRAVLREKRQAAKEILSENAATIIDSRSQPSRVKLERIANKIKNK